VRSAQRGEVLARLGVADVEEVARVRGRGGQRLAGAVRRDDDALGGDAPAGAHVARRRLARAHDGAGAPRGIAVGAARPGGKAPIEGLGQPLEREVVQR
jgi:hypothetical protein